MIDDIFDLRRGEPKVYRHYDCAKLWNAVVELQEPMAVEREDGYAITSGDAETF